MTGALWLYVDIDDPITRDALDHCKEAQLAQNAPLTEASKWVQSVLQAHESGSTSERLCSVKRVGHVKIDNNYFHVCRNALDGRWRTQLSWTAHYEYYNGDGGLLYTGISSSPSERDDEHAKGSSFYPWVRLYRWRYYSTRYAAAVAEWRLIQQHHPPFNAASAFNGQPDWNNNHSVVFTPWGVRCNPHDKSLRLQFGNSTVESVHTEQQACWLCIGAAQLKTLLSDRNVKNLVHSSAPALCPHTEGVTV